MQQSQPRLGDILDDYCPRERRVTNHAVVAMVGHDVKQTRCTTCDAEHAYRRAAVPRQRKKTDAPVALSSPTNPSAPKRVTSSASTVLGAPPTAEGEPRVSTADDADEVLAAAAADLDEIRAEAKGTSREEDVVSEVATEGSNETESPDDLDEGPVHRRLIRATLPRIEGQAPPARQSPDFTIRQPPGRSNRFRPRSQHGGQMFQGNRNGNVTGGQNRGGSSRQPAGHQHVASRPAKRRGPGRKRSK
jgi:hypothetical protein